MVNALLYDCFSGIAGDMHIGAMVDLGVPEAHLRAELEKLSLAGEFELKLERAVKMGIAGIKATVVVDDAAPKPHRRLPDIAEIIQAAGYEAGVERRALGTFQALAEAEAQVHGIDVDAVHFHEVGATDAIVDITAAALGLEALGVERVLSRPVEVGGGMVRCAHGLMPVPAPATAALLEGVPCRFGGVDAEATTPTGAAILKCAVDTFDEPRGFAPARIGYGIGQKDFERPNVLRVMLGQVAAPEHSAYTVETNVEVECNIDDMSPEAFAPLIDALLEAGAKDVFVTPGLMKKSRPGHRVSVLAPPAKLPAIAERLLRGATTLGLRHHDVEKWMLPRQTVEFPSSLGSVRVKVAELPDGGKRWKVEHDDVARLASEQGGDYLAVKAALEREAAAWLNG